MPTRLLAALLTLLAATAARAAEPADAPLAKFLPSDAILYVGWAGADRIDQDYQGTHAQQLLAETKFGDLFARYVPELVAAVLAENQDAAEDARPVLQAIGEIGPIVWRKPTAFAFGGVDWQNELLGGEPAPKLAFICDAGDQAPMLRAALVRLFTDIQRPEIVTLIDEQDGRVYLTLAYSHMDLAALDGEAGGSLADAAPFTDAAGDVLAGFDKGVALAAYLNVPRLLTVAGESIEREGGDVEEFRRAVATLGLDGVSSGVSASGFSGQDFASAAFLGLDADRRGLTRLLPEPGAALDDRALAAIPSDSTLVAAGQLRLDQVVDVLRQLVAEFDPEAAAEFEQGVGLAGMFAGADLERDVLGQFGDTWAAFVSPQIGDTLLAGVAVNSPKDADALRRALTGVSLNVVSVANSNLRDNPDVPVTIPGRTAELGDGEGGTTAYFLNAPLIAPAWAVGEENLTLAFYPQNIAAAAKVAGDGFKGSDAYESAVELCDGNAPAYLTYADLPAMAPRSYPNLLALTQLGVGAGDLFAEYLRVAPPAVVLPGLPTLAENLTPAVSAGWVDDKGLHFRGREPFPLSGLLVDYGNSGGLLQSAPTVMGILAPSLGRSREAANRIKSASNLRMIGQALRQAAIDDVRSGRFPADLREFYLGSDLTVEAFVSPRTDTDLPGMMAAAREVEADWVAANSDYAYLGGGLTDSVGANVMVAFESPAAVGDDEGVNVLFGDGSVRFVTLDEFDRLWQEHLEYRERKQVPLPEPARERATDLIGGDRDVVDEVDIVIE